VPKLAVIGANGQVGAELCLLLARSENLSLIPICRNRSGSAFLRWHGIACRHGRVADSTEAPRLLADCDVVVNCSLATGTPAEIRRIEERIVRHMIAWSKPGAQVIHFSTQSVYGDPVAGRPFRWRNPYGRAKLATERSVRSAQREFRKPVYILRLGHVCGALQEISHTIRSQLRSRTVVLPEHDASSNTVYTAAIVGAIQQIIDGDVEPGTYDLMNTPRWTWHDLYAYEAASLGIAFEPVRVRTPEVSFGSATLRVFGKLAAVLASFQSLRDACSKLFAYVPDSLNARAIAWWYQRRAGTEIAALNPSVAAAAHLSWVENGKRFFPANQTTLNLLQSTPPLSETPSSAIPWPPDLPFSPVSSG